MALCLLISILSTPSYSLELKPKQIRAKTKEKPVSVLQRRYFKKTLRPEFGLLFGNFLNEAYTVTEKRGVRAGLFFTEWLGLELQYIDTSISSSDDKNALTKLKFKKRDPEPGEEDTLVSPEPEINKIHSVFDTNVILAPFYGKLNLLDLIIVYTDLYVAFGAAQLDTDQGAKTAVSFALGQRFYVFKSLSFRIDFRNYSFSEKRLDKTSNRNAQSYDFGMSYFFF